MLSLKFKRGFLRDHVFERFTNSTHLLVDCCVFVVGTSFIMLVISLEATLKPCTKKYLTTSASFNYKTSLLT